MEASNWLVEWHDAFLLVARVVSAIGFDCAEMAFFWSNVAAMYAI